METIILASVSPRRQEYFKLLGIPFSVLAAEIDEEQFTQKNPLKLSKELAVKKIERAVDLTKDSSPEWIFAADTVVALKNKILNKPKDRAEAGEMLRELSGRQHKVITSIVLFNGKTQKISCKSAKAKVYFAPLTDKEIEWYLDTNEWQGAAGAYRIQEKASCFITKIKGCQSAVAGLPLREFYVILGDNGYPYGS